MEGNATLRPMPPMRATSAHATAFIARRTAEAIIRHGTRYQASHGFGSRRVGPAL